MDPPEGGVALSQSDGPDTDGPDTDAARVRRAAVTLAALAQDGFEYSPSEFDTDRYRKVQAVATDLLAMLSGRPSGQLRLELDRDSGYATPKVDVRGVLVDDRQRLLLMRERTDGRWSLPGGWADPGDRPSTAVVREVREETGLGARAVRLLACLDRDARGHTPPLPVAAWKLFVLCERTGDDRAPDELETLDVGWFGLAELPPLSLGRVTAAELELCLDLAGDPSRPTVLD